MSNQDIQQLVPKYDWHSINPDENLVDYEDRDIILIESLDKLPELYATRLKVNIICICKKGRMELDVAESHYVVNKGETFVCPSGLVVSNMMISPDFEFSVLCLTDRIIQNLLSTNVDLWNRAVYVRQEHVVKPSPVAIEKKSQMVEFAIHFSALLNIIIKDEDIPFREEFVRSMLQMMLLGFCSRQKILEKADDKDQYAEVRSPQAKVIFKKFLGLLREEPIKHQPVYYYAEKLFISAKYLSHVCKVMSGKSANDFIQSAVVEDITYNLKRTDLTVKEISVKLGFPNISFFGKYVKTHFGMSPNAYRKQLYAEKN